MYNNYLTITIIIEKIFSCNQSPSHRTTSNAYLTTEVLYRNRRPPHPLQRRQDRTTIKVGGKQKPRCKLNSPIERRGYSCFAKESSEREVQVDGQVVSSSSVSWKGALGSTAYIELDPFEQRDALVEKGGPSYEIPKDQKLIPIHLPRLPLILIRLSVDPLLAVSSVDGSRTRGWTFPSLASSPHFPSPPSRTRFESVRELEMHLVLNDARNT